MLLPRARRYVNCLDSVPAHFGAGPRQLSDDGAAAEAVPDAVKAARRALRETLFQALVVGSAEAALLDPTSSVDTCYLWSCPSGAEKEYALQGKPSREGPEGRGMLASYGDVKLVHFYEGSADMARAAGVAPPRAAGGPHWCPRLDAAWVAAAASVLDVPLFKGDVLFDSLSDKTATLAAVRAACAKACDVSFHAARHYNTHEAHPVEARRGSATHPNELRQVRAGTGAASQ